MTRDDAPHGDDEWAWFAAAYDKVPDPSAANMAHVVHTAIYAAGAATGIGASAAAWHGVRVALWWVLGTGAGLGLAYGGYSLAKSGGTTVSDQVQPALTVTPSPDSTPVDASLPPVDRSVADTLIAEESAPQTPAPAVPAPPPEPIKEIETSPDTLARTDDQTWAASSLGTIADRSRVDLEQLRAKIGDSALHDLAVLVHDAVQAGLPWLSLLRRAADGAAHDLSPAVVLEMVKQRIELLRETQQVLSMYASHYEVNAGADALEAGATRPQIQEVWRAAPQDATAALLTLRDLIAHGVPASAATEAIVQSLSANLSDAALFALRADVVADIARGVPPLTALRDRVQSSEPAPSPPAP